MNKIDDNVVRLDLQKVQLLFVFRGNIFQLSFYVFKSTLHYKIPTLVLLFYHSSVTTLIIHIFRIFPWYRNLRHVSTIRNKNTPLAKCQKHQRPPNDVILLRQTSLKENRRGFCDTLSIVYQNFASHRLEAVISSCSELVSCSNQVDVF